MRQTLVERVLAENFDVRVGGELPQSTAGGAERAAGRRSVAASHATPRVFPATLAAQRPRTVTSLERRAHEAEIEAEQWHWVTVVLRENLYRARFGQARTERLAHEAIGLAELYKKKYDLVCRAIGFVAFALLCLISWKIDLFEQGSQICAAAWREITGNDSSIVSPITQGVTTSLGPVETESSGKSKRNPPGQAKTPTKDRADNKRQHKK